MCSPLSPHSNFSFFLWLLSFPGNPPATGTGTLIIYLEDYNDNAPYVVPSVARVCEDAQEVNVAIVGGRDKDLPPNGAPFKIELGKQLGLDNTWRVTRVNCEYRVFMSILFNSFVLQLCFSFLQKKPGLKQFSVLGMEWISAIALSCV